MLRTAKHWALVLLLVVSISTPWALLQSVAWVGMVARFSHTTSLATALSMAFDGKHPCKLCHIVREAQAEEKEQKKEAPQKTLKLELALPPEMFALFAPTVEPAPVRQVPTSGIAEGPPLRPPPRSA